MTKTTKRISAGALFFVTLIAFNIGKAIFHNGFKDGKTTKQAMVRK